VRREFTAAGVSGFAFNTSLCGEKGEGPPKPFMVEVYNDFLKEQQSDA
jgi:hypothetical protein